MLDFARPPERSFRSPLPDALPQEKRTSRRIRFVEPLRARLGRHSVDLIDLSTTGARIEHDFPITLGHVRVLEFSCDGERVTVAALVTRSRLERRASGAFFRSGLRFASPDQEQLWGLLVSLALDESRSQ